MIRYLAFGIIGLILSFFILITCPHISRLVDILGLITLSVGTGLFLNNIRLAGLLATIGLANIFHVIWAWWFTSIFINNLGMLTNTILWTYILLTISFFILLGLAIHATIKGKVLHYRIDNINLPYILIKTLTVLPIVLLIIILVYTWPHNK